MSADRHLFNQIRKLDRHGLRRVLILVRGLLMTLGDEEGSVAEPSDPNVTYRLESVKCGREGCGACPHGPYWYAYFREDGRLRSRYIGRELPDDVKALETGEN